MCGIWPTRPPSPPWSSDRVWKKFPTPSSPAGEREKKNGPCLSFLAFQVGQEACRLVFCHAWLRAWEWQFGLIGTTKKQSKHRLFTLIHRFLNIHTSYRCVVLSCCNGRFPDIWYWMYLHVLPYHLYIFSGEVFLCIFCLLLCIVINFTF